MKGGLVLNSAAVARVVLAVALVGWAQYGPTGGGVTAQSLGNSRGQGSLGGVMETDPLFAAKRFRALNMDRQKSIVSDTAKLVKLAHQLDSELASNSTGETTTEELHKIAEIEKLAHDVKAKMAQSFGPGPQFREPGIPMGGPGQR
jgi:hypothetical protein